MNPFVSGALAYTGSNDENETEQFLQENLKEGYDANAGLAVTLTSQLNITLDGLDKPSIIRFAQLYQRETTALNKALREHLELIRTVDTTYEKQGMNAALNALLDAVRDAAAQDARNKQDNVPGDASY